MQGKKAHSQLHYHWTMLGYVNILINMQESINGEACTWLKQDLIIKFMFSPPNRWNQYKAEYHTVNIWSSTLTQPFFPPYSFLGQIHACLFSLSFCKGRYWGRQQNWQKLNRLQRAKFCLQSQGKRPSVAQKVSLWKRKKDVILQKPVLLFFSLLEVSSDQCSYWVLEMQAVERTGFLQNRPRMPSESLTVYIYILGSSMVLKKRSGCVNGSKHINGCLHTFIVEITSAILSGPEIVDLGFLGSKSMKLNQYFCRHSMNM